MLEPGVLERVPVNGVEIAYSVHGSATSAPPIILSHGFTGSATDWDGVVGSLAATRPVITFDHRGHGESTNTGDMSTYSFAQLVDDMAGFIDALGLDEFDLLGHSMGGIVAMRYALTRPSGLRSLVLMDTGARPSAVLAAYLQPGIELVRERGTLALFDVRKDSYGDDPEAQRQAAAHRWKLEHMDAAAFEALGTELGDHPPIVDEIGSITVPTTVIVGEHDIAFLDASRELASAIPGAVLDVILSAAHSPQVEQRDAWLTAISDHFARVTS